jgi:hypothetical protein
MRAGILLTMLLVAAPVLAQAPDAAPPADCDVVAGMLEVNEAGELAFPAPTSDQCAAAADLVDRFLGMDRREFRRVVSRESIPGNVYTSISRFGTFGGPWGPIGLPRSDMPGLKHAVSWLTDTLVVIVSESTDFGGATTTVVIADLETLKSCTYTDWPDISDPRSISIQEIQQVLDSGLLDTQDTPACRLKLIAVD